jgi:hypothetical protein
MRFALLLLAFDAHADAVLKVSSLNFLEGRWQGVQEKVAVDGEWTTTQKSMLAAFRTSEDGKVRGYELGTLEEDDEGVTLRLRQLDALLNSRGKTAEYRLTQVGPTQASFAAADGERIDYHLDPKKHSLSVDLHHPGSTESFSFTKKK